jgi:protein-tyrosine phosphatase
MATRKTAGTGGTRRSEIRTSSSHPIYVDWLDAPAKVGMTLAPGVRDSSTAGFRWERDLDADLAQLRELGATALVCLLEDHELDLYGISELVPKAETLGLRVLRLPIRDGGVPRSFEEVDNLLDEMQALESSGGRLVIHCRGGLGRTGTIAGCYLVRHGQTWSDALAMLHRVRSNRCPENPRQEAFIQQYADHVGASRPEPQPGPALLASSLWSAASIAELPSVERTACARRDKRIAAELLDHVEREVAASPGSCLSFGEDGEATLSAAGRTFAAGRFTTPTIGELRSRVAARPHAAGGRVVLSVLHGAHPLSDIGTLQATAPPGTLFQVASQFDCLEAPGPYVVRVRDYLGDSTQGPRASVSAFPGTFLRHYCAPAADGSRFEQTDERCLNLLADVFDASIAEVRSGYLQTQHVRDEDALARALVERFDHIRVGVHAGVEVVFGNNWSGPVPNPSQRISQVFTSTMALGSYSHRAPDESAQPLATACRQLLRAAYLGTLLAALELDCKTSVLTMIGGGVFGNRHRDIWDAIHWSLDAVDPLVVGTKHVLVNTREPVADADRDHVRRRGGAFVELGGGKIEVLQ